MDRVLAVFGSCPDGFRKRCSRARFRDSFAACFAVRGFRVCVLLFEAFGSDVPKARFATVWQRVLLFEAFGFVFCCSRLSEAMFPRPDFARPKRLLFLGFQR